MCGIFGYTSFKEKINVETCKKARDELIHRGPDGAGEYYDEKVYLGHRRLSILDLTHHGAQPMQSNDVAIAVNGEIYNFKELKATLEKNHKFNSNSDSEVVLHGYLEWGINGLLDRLEGMYAFCVYDKRKGLLHIARDRVGIKPLYYYIDNDKFIFASELKAIKKIIPNLEHNKEAIYDFLTYLYIPSPKTLYNSCFKLQPANCLTLNIVSKKTSLYKYWNLPLTTNNISLKGAKSQLLELLQESIQEQLISDVPVGFFLSGGIDSSSVVAIASKTTKHIHTYSIGFDIEEFSETKFAKIVADLVKSNHEEKILTFKKTKSLTNDYTRWYDEPHADTSAFPTYLVSDFAKSSSTVVLTGDGGDELFGGYSIYKKFEKKMRRQLKKLFSLRPIFEKIDMRWSEKVIENFLLDDLELYSRLNGGMSLKQKHTYKKALDIPDDYDDFWYYRQFYKKELEPKTRLQYMEFHTSLHEDILTKVDRTSMAVSLETRVPLLSTKLVEFAFSLPSDIRYHNDELKGILKYSLKNLLPQEILYRKKKGFGIPLEAWGFKTKEHKTLKILRMFNIHI
ncbi:MAG: asparagine synthase (glutamine-hydrolyzing) [Campylobacterales bacterium]